MKSLMATVLMWVTVVAASLAQEDSNGATSGVSEIDGDPPPQDESHYPLERSGGVAVSSADLESYLAGLQERATARAFLLTFPPLLFAAGSTQIEVVVRGELARMADFLRTHADTTARVVGYADDRGGTVSNLDLAERRAAAVGSYLIDLGVDADRLVMTSRGEANPKRDNQISDRRDSNQRVEIFVLKPER